MNSEHPPPPPSPHSCRESAPLTPRAAKESAVSRLFLVEPGNRETVHLLMQGMPVPATFGFPGTDGTIWKNYVAFVRQFHPSISVLTAHRLHPFTRKERLVVLACSVAFNALWSAFLAYQTPTLRRHVARVLIVLIKHLATVLYAVLIRQLVICPCVYAPLVVDTMDATNLRDDEFCSRAARLIRLKILGDRVLLALFAVHLALIVAVLVWMASWKFDTTREHNVRHARTPGTAFKAIAFSELLNFTLWFVKFLPLFAALYPIHRAMWFQGGTIVDYLRGRRSCLNYRLSANFKDPTFPRCVRPDTSRCNAVVNMRSIVGDILHANGAANFHLSTFRRDSECGGGGGGGGTAPLGTSPMHPRRKPATLSLRLPPTPIAAHRFCGRATSIHKTSPTMMPPEEETSAA